MTPAPAPGPASLEPIPDGSVTAARGFTAAAAHAGLKADGAVDVALLVSTTSCATPGLARQPGGPGGPPPCAPPAPARRGPAPRLTPLGGVEAARAIMTTDTRPKHCAVRLETAAGIVTVGGIAKGAGMIHPDMATLLAVLTTDAVAEPAALQPLLRRVADRSFNAISVDGDTSTNDTALLLANGASGVDPARD